MSESFDIKVQIRQEFRKGLIFGFNARLPVAVILAFLGYRHQVMPLLQTLSQGTRAYTINADGFHGFVVKFEILKFLGKANQRGELEHAKKWQHIDIDTIIEALEKAETLAQSM